MVVSPHLATTSSPCSGFLLQRTWRISVQPLRYGSAFGPRCIIQLSKKPLCHCAAVLDRRLSHPDPEHKATVPLENKLDICVGGNTRVFVIAYTNQPVPSQNKRIVHGSLQDTWQRAKHPPTSHAPPQPLLNINTIKV